MTETRFNHLPLCDRPMPAAELIKDMHMEDVGGILRCKEIEL